MALSTRPHSGWQEEEEKLLWQEVESARHTGEPLSNIFDRLSEKLNRKPNSIRNYYYMQMKAHQEPNLRRAGPFETFSQNEIHDLVKGVLKGLGEGQSVRGSVMQLSGGDQKKMLRFQNKYRSVLKKRPQLVFEVAEELAQEKLPCLNPLAEKKEKASSENEVQDPDLLRLLQDARTVACKFSDFDPKGDRARVQLDLCRMQLEDLQKAASELVILCKEMCADQNENDTQEESRQQMIASLSAVENLCG